MKKTKDQLSAEASLKMVRNLIMKETKPLDNKNLAPGNLVFFTYDAKDKTNRWDKTPMVFCLRLSSNYLLGLNFHYLPVRRRKILYQYLFSLYGNEIEKQQRIVFSWSQIRAFVLKLGKPVLRLYIRKRMSKRGVKVPFNLHQQAINLRVETFIKGAPKEEVLFARAAKAMKKKGK
jgi:hypothetical protein